MNIGFQSNYDSNFTSQIISIISSAKLPCWYNRFEYVFSIDSFCIMK